MNDVIREWAHEAEGDFATASREMAAADAPNFDAVCEDISFIILDKSGLALPSGRRVSEHKSRSNPRPGFEAAVL